MTQDEKRIEAVMNMLANATTIMTASMSGALGNAVGGAFAGMGEAVGAALGDGEAARQRGDAIRQEVSREVDAKMHDLVAQTQREVLQGMGEAVASLTPAQKKDLAKEFQNDVYQQAVEAATRADFGLPPLTGRLSLDDLLKCFAVQDPRLGELVQKILALPQPKVFAQLQEAERKKREKREKRESKEESKKARAVKPAPARITKLPATFRFPPGAKAEIALKSAEPLWIKWDAKLRPGECCENYGIEGRDAGGGSATTPTGGAVFYPEDGTISGTLTNKESFAIVVEIVTEPKES